MNVRSNGLITLVDVTANQNGNDGANLGNNGANATSNIEVIAGRFNNNNVDGLYANSKGNITLVNVTAQNNGDDGVELIFPNNGTHTATICGGVSMGKLAPMTLMSKSITVLRLLVQVISPLLNGRLLQVGLALSMVQVFVITRILTLT